MHLGEAFSIGVGPSSDPVPSQELTTFQLISLTLNLDEGDSCSFEFAGSDPAAVLISELTTDVWLYRRDPGLPAEIVQRFRIVKIDQSWDEDGGDVASVQAICYRRVLLGRITREALSFTADGQGDIVWGLIDHAQSAVGGDYGLTAGILDNTVIRDRNYSQGENIGNLLANLADDLRGPWIKSNGDMTFDARSQDDFPRRFMPIKLGVNARRMVRQSGADQFANGVLVSGDMERTTPVLRYVDDIASDPRGVWERTASSPSVVLQDTLDSHADGFLTASRQPVAGWAVELDPERWLGDSGFMPGDVVDLAVPPSSVAPVGAPPVVVAVQVIEVAVRLTLDGDLGVALSVIELQGSGSAIGDQWDNARWGLFQWQ